MGENKKYGYGYGHGLAQRFDFKRWLSSVLRDTLDDAGLGRLNIYVFDEVGFFRQHNRKPCNPPFRPSTSQIGISKSSSRKGRQAT